MEIAHKYINKPDFFGIGDKDGLGIHTEEYFHVHDCIIDLSGVPLSEMDEAFSPTWGAHGLIESCLIRGAGKLVLCGCGDEQTPGSEAAKEIGKGVTFKRCVLEDFGRRGPEVQGGMVVVLSQCLVRNWGVPSRFDTRAFGAWAHDGGVISAQHTIFHQSDFCPSLWCWLRDHIGHFGQAINERGFFRALFHKDAWLSGYRRGLTAGPKGFVFANLCHVTDSRIVIDTPYKPMNEIEYATLLNELTVMVDRLVDELVRGKDA